MKPYDGGAWVGVSKIDNVEELWRAYEHSGTLIMNLQAGVVPYDYFVRCIGLGPQTRCVNYDPGAPLHNRYLLDTDFLARGRPLGARGHDAHHQRFFGWDFNSCEALRKDGVWYPIDFANACPDSQVTSLHLHFPWLIKANVRWSLFCAATKRRMRPNLDWQPFFDIAAEDMPYRERLRAYARDRPRALRDRALPRVLRQAPRRISTRSPTSSSARRSPAMRCTRRCRRCFRRTRSRSSPSFSGAASSAGGRHEGARAVREVSRWRSPRLEREVTVARWGHWGTPVLLFPTAGGDAAGDRAHAGDRGAPAADRGGPDQGLFLRQRRRRRPGSRSSIPRPTARCCRTASTASSTRRWCRRSAPTAARTDVEIVAAGASIGAFNAVASLCRHPDAVPRRHRRSAAPMIWKSCSASRADDNFYFSSPLLFRRQSRRRAAARSAAPPLRAPRLRPGPLGEPGGILAHGRRARPQGDPQSRRSLGPRIRSRLADLAPDAAALSRRAGLIGRETPLGGVR